MKKLYTKKGVHQFLFRFLASFLGRFMFVFLAIVLSMGSASAQNTWYNIKDGNWNDPTVWTLDPAGLIPNPNPNTQLPVAADNIVIKSGKRVTVNVNNLSHASLTVEGEIDFGTTTGHTFTTINGNGRVKLAADNFPSGNAADFTAVGSGGMVEYYGSSYSLATARTFNNVQVSLTAGQVITLMNDYTINGNLQILSGGLKINDNASTVKKNLTIVGDLTVNSGCSISVGTAVTTGTDMFNMYHQINIYGDFTNNGTVRLTNRTVPIYNADDASGAANLVFKGLGDSKLTCNGITDVNTLQLNKGTDATYVLDIYATNSTYFQIFGKNNGARPNIKALSIQNGTIKLTGQVVIPTLGEGGGDWGVPGTGGLWIAGPNVQVYSTAYNASQVPTGAVGVDAGSGSQALTVEGQFRITDGYMSTRNSAGFIFWSIAGSNAVVTIEGGTCDVTQFRYAATGGLSSLVMSGGILNIRENVGASGEYTTSFPQFELNSTSSFIMSGGEIVLSSQQALTTSGTEQLRISAPSSNVNVTGGKITIANMQGVNTALYSTANLWNVDVKRHSTATGTSRSLVLLYSDLKVLNTLNIMDYATLVPNDNTTGNFKNVSVGGDLTVSTNGALADFVPSSPATLIQNTFTLNGSGNSVVTFSNKTGLSTDIQQFYRFVIDKPSSRTVTINAAKSNFTGDNNNLFQFNRLFQLNGGTLYLNNYSITSSADSVVNYGTVGLASTGNDLFKFANKTAVLVSGTGASFGNVRLASSPSTVSLNGNAYFKRLQWNSGSASLGTFNLKIDQLDFNGVTPSTSNMFLTSGQASDGGLSLYVPTTGNNPSTGTKIFTYPLGISGKYTSGEITISGTTTGGYITMNPDDNSLQTLVVTEDNLTYFWRLRASGFTTNPTVSKLIFKYYNSDLVGTINGGWRVGQVLDYAPYTIVQDVRARIDDPSSNYFTFNNSSVPFILNNSNYTIAKQTAFAHTFHIYYSRSNSNTLSGAIDGNWTTAANWNKDPNITGSLTGHESSFTASSSVPGAGDIVFIGFDNNGGANQGKPHAITIDGSAISCAEVNFTQMKNGSGNAIPKMYVTNYVFRPTLCITNGGTLSTSFVRGEGSFWCRNTTPDFTAIDMGEFALNDSSYVTYEVFSSPITISNTPAAFPNLEIGTDNWGGNNHTITFTKNIVTRGNVEILGNTNIQLNNGATGDFTIGRDLKFFESNLGGTSGGGGSLLYPTSGTARKVYVGRDLFLRQPTTGATVSVSGNSAMTNELHVSGNILLNQASTASTGLLLWQSGNTNVTNLYLDGSTSMSFTKTSGQTPALNRLIINKGSSIATTAYCNSNFTLNGSTNGTTKALEITDGLFIVDNSSLNINLTTGSDYFAIPSTAGLEVRQGTVNATGTSGINLDGLLRIGTGTVNLAGGVNNIVYGAAGIATIDINGAGFLTVGGVIRRQSSNDLGVLKYLQSSGTALIGQSGVTDVANRGVFEVLNPGSQFTFTGGTLTFRRQASATAGRSSLILDPASYNLAGSTINIFDSSTPASQTNFGINSTIPLNNLVISGTNNPRALSTVTDLQVDGAFTVGSNTTYDANNYNQYFKGNVTVNGTFTASSPSLLAPTGSTVNMVGVADQSISGTLAVYNYYQNTPSKTVTLGATTALTINGSMEIKASSTFSDGGNAVSLKKTFTNDGVTVSPSGNGIQLNGTVAQDMSGNGVTAVLTLDNTLGFNSLTNSSLTISKALRLRQGILNAGGNLITIQSAASIVPVLAFSNTNMIQTNVSISDAGVRKYLPSGALVDSVYFPLGRFGLYTPVKFKVDANTSSTGYISVNAAAESHPTVTDVDNVLRYYWILKSSGLTGFTGAAVMNYQQTDVKLNGHLESDYISARLLSSLVSNPSLAWNKWDTSTVNETANNVRFTFSGADDGGISGDYTAGVDEHIPNNVLTYTSTKDGNWTDVTAWTPTPPTGGPSGSKVVVKHYITQPLTYTSSYATEIQAGGTLNIPSNTPQRLGNISGAGTLKLNGSGLPAGDYVAFMDNTASIVEFSGTADYIITPPMYGSYNNVVISGTAKRYLPSTDVLIKGYLTINGSDASLEVNNNSNKNISIGKDLTFTQGKFSAGTSTSTVILNGVVAQKITGAQSFSGTNALYSLQINNSNGVTLFTNVDVYKTLTFTNGVIGVGDAYALNVQNDDPSAIVGASSTRYVDGMLGKLVIAGQDFTFPVGDGARNGDVTLSNTVTVGTTLWQAKYYNVDASSWGYPTSSYDASLQYVSTSEFWSVKSNAASGTPTANVTVRWDALSGVGSTSTDYTNLRQSMWYSGSSNWKSSGNIKTGTYASGTVESDSPLTFNNVSGKGNMITWGSVTPSSDFNWLGTTSTDWFVGSNWSTGSVPSVTANVIIPTSPASGRFPVVSNGLASAKNLTINGPNGILTLNPGGQMTVEGTLTNTGTMKIQNTPAQMASLKTNGTISQTGAGASVVETTLPLGTRYWYYGFTVNGSAVTSGIWNAVSANTSAYKFFGSWLRFTNNTDLLNGNPIAGLLNGYSVKLLGSGTTTLTSTGSLNNGDLSIALVASGFTLVCNPYPSALDMLSIYQASPASFGAGKIASSVWVPTNASGSLVFATYNLATGVGQNGGSKILAPGQGFWLRNTAATTTTFIALQASRLHSVTNLKSLSTPTGETDVFRMQALNSIGSDEAVIVFRSIGSVDFSSVDSEKRLSGSGTICNLYSIKSSKSIAINVMPTFESETIVPLGYSVGADGAGEIILRATNLDTFDKNIDVWLEDRTTGQTLNLREVGDVSVTVAAGNSIDRFVLHFAPSTKGTATSIVPKETAQGTASLISISQLNKSAVVSINTDKSIDATIALVSQDGRVISVTNTKLKETVIALPSTHEIYLVQVVFGSDVNVKKVVAIGE